MIAKQNNQISSYTSAYNVDDNSGVNFNETKMLTYHVLRKQRREDGPIYLNESNSRYVDIFFSKMIVDWTKPF